MLCWGRQCKDEGSTQGMLREEETLESERERERRPVWERRTFMCDGEQSSRQASVQRRGRGTQQHSVLLSC